MRAAAPRPTRSLGHRLRHAYWLRWKRRRLLFRILRKRGQLTSVRDKTDTITPGQILLFCCLRNEVTRLPHFLSYYRALGVDHFLMVDNGSDDGSDALLADQPDVSLWSTPHSYRLSRFGMDWLGWLQMRFGHGHWCLTVDADELLIYPHHDSHPLSHLTAWLDRQGRSSFGALMLDLYPKGPLGMEPYVPGTDPVRMLPCFDAEPYRSQWHKTYDNLWIQGGVRDRMFFQADPGRAPTLNKTPLVKWNRRFSYVSSTHQIVPTHLHDVFGDPMRTVMTGALLHTKFLDNIVAKSQEELTRKEHFENSALYTDYYRALIEQPTLWNEQSVPYEGWEQLTRLGLMSKEDWV